MIRRPPRSTLFPTRRSSDLCGAVAWDGLSDEQREIRELVRSLARERIAPRAAEIDKRGEFPWDMVELMREHEVLGLPYDEAYGGTGTGALMVLVADRKSVV